MAIKVWRGDAQGVAQVDKVTVENVEIGDIFTLTINRKDVSFTATAATETSVYAGLAAAIAAADIPEFPPTAASVAAAGSEAAHLLLTGASDGTPYTISGSTTNGGTSEVDIEVEQAGGGGVNMKQLITLPSGLTGGTFTLSFEGQTTSALTYDESAADIETALKALSNIGASDVSVTGDDGGPWTVEFTGTLAEASQTLLSGDGSSLAGQSVTVATTTQGAPGDNHQATITATQLLTATDPVGVYLSGGYAAGTVTVSEDASEATWTNWIAYFYDVLTSEVVLSKSTTTNATQSITTISFEIIGSKGGQSLTNPSVSASTITGYDPDGSAEISITSTGGNSSNEVQTIRLPGEPTGGTFTLTFQGQTTGNIAYNASSATVETALEALSNIGSGDATVTDGSGGGWDVEFTNNLAATDLAAMTGSGANLTGGTVLVATSQAAVEPEDERVLVTLSDNVTSGTFTLTYDSSESAAIAYNAAASAVKSALEGTASIGSGDVNVTGPAGGPWLIEFQGSLAGTDVSAVTGDGTSLVGAGTQGITVTSDTTPTGPYHWDNANNWESSGVPANSDTVVFEANDNPVLYGLDQSAVTLTALIIRANYTGTIGLPEENSAGFIEYRDTHLQIGATTVRIGEGTGNGSERIRIDFGSVQTDVSIFNSATPAATGEYAVNLLGSHASNVLRAYKGSISSAQYAGEAAVWNTVQVGFADDQASDVELFFGDDVTLGAVTIHGGVITNSGQASSAVTSILVTAGTVTLNGTDGVSQLDIEGGTVYYRSSGTLGGNTVVGGAGTLSFEGDLRAKTVTNSITCRGDAAEVIDSQEVVSSLSIAYQSTSRLPELGTNFTVARS